MKAAVRISDDPVTGGITLLQPLVKQSDLFAIDVMASESLRPMLLRSSGDDAALLRAISMRGGDARGIARAPQNLTFRAGKDAT